MKSLVLFLIPFAIGLIIFLIIYKFILLPIAKRVRKKELEREANDIYYKMKVIEKLQKDEKN